MDDDAQLIQELRRGNPAAYETAIRAYHQLLIAVAAPLVGRDLAKDVAQETWCNAFANLDQFEGRSKLRTWLARIAVNEALTLRKRRQREIPWTDWGGDTSSPFETRFNSDGRWVIPPTQWHHDTPEDLLTAVELQECIRQHLDKLPRDQQSVLVMRELVGLDISEIAALLGVTLVNTRVLLHRGRQRMYLMLERYEDVGTC
ncbi:RNA polymerase sigma factor [Pseudomonas sp. D(2018)]|uniref:RNA polymerase sigma factor n=1 Tax=Pseudomonas sp. D(2018) TaxID=2502238 RepID=UPI0014855468|nr:RNA polymerase sigma factor [Pseudomonas sp. D(2018)]